MLTLQTITGLTDTEDPQFDYLPSIVLAVPQNLSRSGYTISWGSVARGELELKFDGRQSLENSERREVWSRNPVLEAGGQLQ